MKKINKFLLLLSISLFTFVACDSDTEDIVTGDAAEGGAIVKVLPSLGKALGVPQTVDLATTEVTFTDVSLDLTIALKSGGVDVTKYEIVKSLNGGQEIVVASDSSLPLSVNYAGINDYFSGTEISNSADLRIGDIFKFRTKMYTNTGTYYANDGDFSVKIGCSSDLAFDYAVTCTRPSDGASWNQGIETLIEKAPGLYKTVTTGGWGAGTIAPDQGFDFEDLCNSLTLPKQNLAQGYYGNNVYQTDDQAAASVVDSETGNLHIEYTISFASGDAAYINEYIKQ